MYKKLFNYFIYFLLFTLIFLPIIYLFVSIFFPNLKLTNLYSLWNYIIFSFDSRLISIFSKTLLVGFSVSIISGIVGLVLAIILECSNLSYRNFFKFLLFIPFLIPPYLLTFSWLAFLGKRGTFVNITFPNLPLNIYSPLTVVVLLSLSFYPISMFIISLGLKNMDRNLIDAGRLSNSKKLIRKVVIPLVKPHFLISCFFVFVLSISEYVVPSFLRVNVYPAEIFAQLAAFYNLRRAIVYSLPLIALALFVSGLLFLYFRKKSFVTLSTYYREKKEFIRLEKHHKALAYFFILLLLSLSLLVPASMIIIESELSFFNAVVFAKESILNSLLTASLGATLITLLGFFTYYFLKDNNLLMLIIAFPLAIASPVIGTSLINFYNNLSLPIYGTILIVLLGYLLRFLPFSIFIFAAFFPQISSTIEESARLCSPNFFKTIYKIILPLNKGGFLSSFIIIFIFCLGEIGVTQMVSPPGFQTLPIRIETLMHYGNYSYVASLSLFLLLFIFFFYILYWLVYRKHE